MEEQVNIPALPYESFLRALLCGACVLWICTCILRPRSERTQVKSQDRANTYKVRAKKSEETLSYGIRTVNRHRWMGRVSQGVRENPRSGTRQYNDRNFGIRSGPTSVGPAAKDAWRLFNKNTGPCEAVRQSIGTDAWPVSERYEERSSRRKMGAALNLSADERRR